MTVAESSLNAHRIRLARCTLPRVGTWFADVWTDDEILAEELAAAITLRLGSLSLVGRFIRGETWQGSTRLRLIGGAGGWRRKLQPRWYASDAGVRASIVASDAARECGETISEGVATDSPLGAWFARPQQLASRTLQQLALPWRVLPDGTTSLRAWPATRIATTFDVVAYDAARCIVELATDTPSDWLPGRAYSSPRLPAGDFIASDIVLTAEPNKLRVQAWSTRA